MNKSIAQSNQNSLDAHNTFHTSNLPHLSDKNLDKSVQERKHPAQHRKSSVHARGKGKSALNSSNLSVNNAANSDLSQYIESFQRVKVHDAPG